MTGAVILAAGSSSRLGQPKQKLLFRGETLLQHSVDAAIEADCRPIIVVLGFDAEVIGNDIADKQVITVINNDWQEGMGSSIRTGMRRIIDLDDAIEEILLLLCDQPFVDGPLLKKITEQKKLTQKQVVACSYGGTIGVPAVFDKSVFGDLLNLKGQEGAKKLLQSTNYTVDTISFPSGTFDIDTTADYNKLNHTTGDNASL